MFKVVDESDVYALPFREHFMLQVPAGSSGELSDDCVTVAHEIDVEVDVVDWLEKVSLCTRRMVDMYLHRGRCRSAELLEARS